MTQSNNIPILRLPFTEDDIEYYQKGVADIIQSGSLTLGKYTAEFEALFARLAGTTYALSVTNGTAALDLIFRCLDIRDASIIVPTNTFMATALAPLGNRNRIIFADSDPGTLCLDLEDVTQKIAPDTKAIVLVHIGGVISPDIYGFRELCDARGIYLIEDAAHAHGCSIDGHLAGSLGYAAGFSMFPTKVLTTGEGGVLTTNNDELYQRALIIRNQGKNPSHGGAITELGHNFRLSEFTALIGVRQLEKASYIIKDRQRAAHYYDKELPSIKGIYPLKLPENATSSYYKYICYLHPDINRGELKTIMRETFGVSLTGEVYASLCHEEPVWQSYTYCGNPKTYGKQSCNHGQVCQQTVSTFPGANQISKNHICLPVYPGLTNDQLAYIVESLDKSIKSLLQ